jgi:hypothetical protein
MYEPGRKLESDCAFGVICLPACTRGGTSGRNVELGPKLFLTSELPFAQPEHLEPMLGSSRYRGISDARVYLVYHTDLDAHLPNVTSARIRLIPRS